MTPDQEILQMLRTYESRNVTYFDPDGTWPIVWERAKGVHVWDAAGRKYLDLTSAFGVANAGHANPAVVRAARDQMGALLHAMGDVHPHALKARLAHELSRITFERWSAAADDAGAQAVQKVPAVTPGAAATGKTIFCNSGFEAVEAALKTALLATGRRGVIAFEGAYHGLGYGALNATHRDHFRGPFASQLGGFGCFATYAYQAGELGMIEEAIRHVFERQEIGAVLVEPVQGRGGIHVPPAGFLAMLRRLCDEHDALLVADEVFTGFGRTGRWFACEHEQVTPDLICVGKALTGGFPLSACVGRADVMDTAWAESTGEAVHTSTFLGHPVGCAMALAQIGELETKHLIERSAKAGRTLQGLLGRLKLRSDHFKLKARGIGLMTGVELQHQDGSPAGAEALAVVKRMLHRGFILLPEGGHGEVISLTPPLTISEGALKRVVRALDDVLHEVIPA